MILTFGTLYPTGSTRQVREESVILDAVGKQIWEAVKRVAKVAVPLALLALVVVGVLAMAGVHVALTESSSETAELAAPDTAPVEFAYFDAPRAESYLDQADGGIEKTIERKEQVTRAINATFSSGANAQLGGSQQAQQDTVTTVTPQAADRFYTLLRQLRPGGREIADSGGKCTKTHEGKPLWMGTVNDGEPIEHLAAEVGCIGEGDFIRIRKVQLQVPSLLRMQPRLRYATAVHASTPAPRVPFYWPDRSPAVKSAERAYLREVSSTSRVMLVGEPYAAKAADRRVAFVLPALYRGLSREPTLLSGPVTVVGVLVRFSTKERYVDYPTVVGFGSALIAASRVLDAALGLCSANGPARHGSRVRGSVCRSHAQMLADVEGAVTVNRPFAVVLPIAVYG